MLFGIALARRLAQPGRQKGMGFLLGVTAGDIDLAQAFQAAGYDSGLGL